MASSFEAEEVLDPLSATAPKSELTPASLPATVSSESSTEADQVHQGYNHPVLQRKEEDYAREGDVEDNVQEEGHDSEAKNGDQQSREEHSVQIHEIVVVEALKALLDNGITVMEYGSQLMFRFGREECLVAVEWAVPDEQLSRASEVLQDCGYPRVYGNERPEFGYWDQKCLSHDLGTMEWMCVHLLTLTLVDITLGETIEVPSTFTDELRIRSPKPQRYLMSLLRHLLNLPVGDASRMRIEKDLGCFYSSYLMHSPPAHRRYLEARETDEEYQARVEDGVRMLKSWDWTPSEEVYLEYAERSVRDARLISEMTEVIESSPEPWVWN